MGLLETLRPSQMVKPDGYVLDRIKRGGERRDEGKVSRQECLAFWRGDQYVYRSGDGYLVKQGTVTNQDGTGKPRWRVRQTRNLIAPMVEEKVSAATQRIPGYEVSPQTMDPEDIAAARLAAKVAIVGYDRWRLRRATRKVVTLALVADEGFAWPYFDENSGTFENGLPSGEVKVRVYNRNEVSWESGVEFEESRWHAIEHARPIGEVQSMEGFIGGNLKPDAEADNWGSQSKAKRTELVLVTEYLERPCPQYPAGRWLTCANGRLIHDERPYPLTDHRDRPVDEPILHRLSYTVDPDSDQDMGLVRHMIDAQRTYSDCNNKLLEAKNLALNPQVIGPPNFLRRKLNDEPGAYFATNGDPNLLKWREPPPAALFAHLRDMKEEAKRDMQYIAGTGDIPPQLEAGKAVQVFIEQQQSRWAAFVSDLADFHSRLMRHCLVLVGKHYTTPRLLEIRGRYGSEPIADFQGADLRGQVDVRVLPGSIEPLTRDAIERKITFLVQNFPGSISPEAAMAALDGGTAEQLIRDYELHIARANRIIQKIKQGPEVLFGGAPEPPEGMQDEEAMQYLPWMPRPFDRIDVHLQVFETWMCTEEFEALEPGMREAANVYYGALKSLKAQQQAEAMAAQVQTAEALGMANATRGPLKPMPDQPQLNGGTAPTPA